MLHCDAERRGQAHTIASNNDHNLAWILLRGTILCATGTRRLAIMCVFSRYLVHVVAGVVMHACMTAMNMISIMCNLIFPRTEFVMLKMFLNWQSLPQFDNIIREA